MTAIELEQIIHDVDLMLNPYLVICNPEQKAMLEENLGNNCKIKACSFIEKGTVICIDIREMDKEWKSILSGQ